MTSIHTHEVRAKDSERAEIESQLSAFLAAGGIPEIVTTCRPEKMSQSQAERNAATFLDAGARNER